MNCLPEAVNSKCFTDVFQEGLGKGEHVQLYDSVRHYITCPCLSRHMNDNGYLIEFLITCGLVGR